MPRAFDDAEKGAIRAAMKVAGLKHFERAGVRAARIDDICREVGIAKGSFYAFYPSKEELFMAIVEEREDQHQADMLEFLGTRKGTARGRAGGFFDLILKKIESDPVLNLVLAAGEIPHLVRKLGPERFAAGQAKDRAFAAEAVQRWRAADGPKVNASDLLGLMTITLSVASQRRQMTPAQFEPAVALLRELFVERLAGARS
ncbi:MAG: TetR/AcrR family transcriptional regulator [Devosia sp.]